MLSDDVPSYVIRYCEQLDESEVDMVLCTNDGSCDDYKRA